MPAIFRHEKQEPKDFTVGRNGGRDPGFLSGNSRFHHRAVVTLAVILVAPQGPF